MITRPVRRIPEPGQPERAFLDQLNHHALSTSVYNLPDWDGDPDTLGHVLQNLFQFTPPTALIIDEPPLFFSVLHHLARIVGKIFARNNLDIGKTRTVIDLKK